MSARETIVEACEQVLRDNPGCTTNGLLPELLASALDAFERERTVVAVRLLRVQPGDIVIFHFIEPLSAQEHDEFLKAMQPLGETHPDVRFLAAESVDDITVVRGPEYTIKPAECTGLDKLREVANRPMSREEFSEITGEGKQDG